MTTGEKKKEERVKELIKELFSSDDQRVVSAMAELREIGDVRVVSPMLELYARTDNEAIKREVIHFLFSLNTENAIDPLMEALRAPHMRPHRAFILSVFWNSGIQPIEHLREIVGIGLHGDYHETLEALTVIENMDGPFEGMELADSIFDIREEIEEIGDHHRRDLVSSLEQVLVNFQNQQQ